MRRLERPRWINVRTVFGLLLFAVSLILGQRSLASPSPTVRFWVASHDVAPGTILDQSDLSIVEADLPSDALKHYALGTTDLAGSYVTTEIPAGQLVPLDALSASPPSGSRQMTIPVEPEHAVGGDLSAGDVVDILVTLEAGRPTARTSVLVSGAEVLGLVRSGGSFGAEGQPVGITIAIAAEDAPRLALALRTGAIDVVRAVASEPVPDGEVTAEDL